MKLTRYLLSWILCAAFAAPALAQSQPDGLAPAIEQVVATAAQSGASQVRGVSIAWPDVMLDLYQRRQFQPVWSRADSVNQLLAALEQAKGDGLNPADFNLTLLSAMRAEVAAPAATAPLRAEFDLLLTDSMSRLIYQLAFGKVDPKSFVPQWNFGRMIDGTAAVDFLTKLVDSGEIGARIEAIKPSHRMYQDLKRELARYRAIEQAGGWPVIPPGPSLKPGMSDARVAVLRTRLTASGDLTAAAAQDASMYDESLVAGVKHFQSRMGQDADGVLGAGTLTELNVSVSKRIDTMLINLDRGRVLLRDLPAEVVVVNVAGFWVYLVRNGEVVWRGRAQVGKPYRKTPIFRSEINYLVFNPTWTVPPGIIANDILPAAKKDPAAITRKGLDVIDRSGRKVPPASVDWSQFRSGNIPYTLVQQPGPDNALGRVKFMFPNPYSVYLHDTPSKSKFEESARAFSSGCVRVERPLELAELLLGDPGQWNAQAISRVIDGGKLQNVTLARKVPILLTYWTAWVDNEGVVNFRPDVYEQDPPWLAGLKQNFVAPQVRVAGTASR